MAISRATLAPSSWLELGAKLVHAGGDVWVLLAREAAPDAGSKLVREEEIAYAWPLGGHERRAVRYRVAGS